jgi:hypothetical protein
MAENVIKKCPGCALNKIKTPIQPAVSRNSQECAVGQRWYTDLVYIKNNNASRRDTPYQLLVEKYTGFIVGIKYTDKTKKSFKAASKSFKIFLDTNKIAVGLKIEILCDNESAFSEFAEEGFKVLRCAPEQHVGKVERYNGIVLAMWRTIRNTLPYSLPIQLYSKLMDYCIFIRNHTCNSQTGMTTPHRLITGQSIAETELLNGQFGTLVVCRKPQGQIKDRDAERGQLGIVIGC